MNKSEFDALCASVSEEEKQQVIELLTGRKQPMPDRAVVDQGSPCPATKDGIWPHSWTYRTDDTGEQQCMRCNAVTIPEHWIPICPKCESEMSPDGEGGWHCIEPHQPAPRALVALSDDRYWIVALTSPGHEFSVLHRNRHDYLLFESIPDTGQDAREVLKEFLNGR